MASIFRAYTRLLHERPIITNALTASTFMLAGDLISQALVQQRDHIDYGQTVRFAIAGFMFVGPVARTCLVTIDKLFGATSSAKVLGKKLLLDQCVFAPAFLAGNISLLTLLKTRSTQEVKQEIKRSYVKLLKLNYTFWPFVQMLNFYFIPLAYRVVFGSCAALIWNTLFSYKLYNQKKKAKGFSLPSKDL